MQEPLRDGGPAGPEPADPADGRGRGPAGKGKLPAVRGRTRGGRPRDPRRLVADRGGPLAGAADQARLNFNLKFNLRAAAGKPRASPVPSWAGAGPGAGATNPAADPAVQVSRARRGRRATFRGLPAEKSAGVRVPRPAGAPACTPRLAGLVSYRPLAVFLESFHAWASAHATSRPATTHSHGVPTVVDERRSEF